LVGRQECGMREAFASGAPGDPTLNRSGAKRLTPDLRTVKRCRKCCYVFEAVMPGFRRQ
jgi:hypothetical protein